jgi:hypothetical protein
LEITTIDVRRAERPTYEAGEYGFTRSSMSVRFDRAMARWHARFVLKAQGITANKVGLPLFAAEGLAGLNTRDTAAETLRRIATEYGLSSVVAAL